MIAIDDEKPCVALGCVASFPVRDEGMRIDAVDPEKEGIEPISLDAVTRDRFALDYYLPFLRALDFGGAANADLPVNDFNETFVATDFANFGLLLALPRALVVRLRGALAGNSPDSTKACTPSWTTCIVENFRCFRMALEWRPTGQVP
ncbi:hypothetical protein [Saccharopolyspora spinosa]|uniref:Uncharacterized protein n=1 Tax=Saccharopolyspora spinosa TaxID=60894 RepID=A0A2N3XWB2_SACSN|nr:hypothetical protein [Saccharopolyspora spinosa]PKW14966.1 hypothetical protein A8926_2623 [Saccharopolyspora spinosa]